MRQIAVFLFLTGVIVTALSFLGVITPVGDSLAVFRPLLAAFAFLLALWAWFAGWHMLRRAAVLLALVSLISVAWHFVPRPLGAGPTLAVYQKNMLFQNPDWRPLSQDILGQETDIVTLQEVSDRNFPILNDLADTYPTQHFCPFSSVGGVAVLSKLPATGVPPICNREDGLAAIQVVGPNGPLWLASLHLHWPWPHRQHEQIMRLSGWFASLQAPLILGGDFNMIPWSHLLRNVQSQTNTDLAGPAQFTLWLTQDHNIYPIAIDHILAPGGGSLSRRPLLGSDHYGLVALAKL